MHFWFIDIICCFTLCEPHVGKPSSCELMRAVTQPYAEDTAFGLRVLTVFLPPLPWCSLSFGRRVSSPSLWSHDLCSGLSGNGPHRLTDSNSRSLVGGAIWDVIESLEGRALLEEVCQLGQAFRVFSLFPFPVYFLGLRSKTATPCWGHQLPRFLCCYGLSHWNCKPK